MRLDAPVLSTAPDALPDPASPGARLLQLLGTCLVGLFGGGLVGIGLGGLVWGVDFTTASFVPAHPDHYPFARGFVLLSNSAAHLLGFTVGPLLLLHATLPRRWWQAWAAARLAPGPALGLLGAAVLLIVSIPALSWIIDWNAHVHPPTWLGPLAEWARRKEDEMRALTELITQQRTALDLVSALVGVALIPAIGEELTFRGILQPTLARVFGNSPTAGIWVAALVFSAIHVQFFGFVPRLLLGAAFGYLYVWSGRLWVPVAAHFVNNGLQLVLLYLHQHGQLAFNPANDTPAPLSWVVGSAALTVAGAVALRRYLLARAAAQLQVPALRNDY